MTSRDEYVEKLKKQLDEWNGTLDVLSAKAASAKQDVKAKVDTQLADLRVRHAEATQRVGELKKAGEGSWQDLKGGLETARNALKESIDKARAHFD